MCVDRTIAHPVRTFREAVEALELAMLTCRSAPSSGAVHHVRTRIRRVEAQLLLLKQMPHLLPLKVKSKALVKGLHHIQRIVSKIGDLDVQSQLLWSQRKGEGDRRATKLEVRLRHQRERDVPSMLHRLTRSSVKISVAMAGVLMTLKSSENLSLTASDLAKLTKSWFARQDGSSGTNKGLHTIRKAAKLARYMAEGAPGSPVTKHLAEVFEEIQDAGGKWHDWFQLTKTAQKRLRKRDLLIRRLKSKRKECASDYRRRLKRFGKHLESNDKTPLGLRLS